MVKKDTIGKIQLVIGIIVLIAAIIGFYVAYNLNSHINQYTSGYANWDAVSEDNSLSNETKAILLATTTQVYLGSNYFVGNLILSFSLSSALGLILSLLFITQGLANMGEKNVK